LFRLFQVSNVEGDQPDIIPEKGFSEITKVLLKQQCCNFLACWHEPNGHMTTAKTSEQKNQGGLIS